MTTEAPLWTVPRSGRRLHLHRPLVAGILNLNPDSFSGDGAPGLDHARQRVGQLVADGADIIDVGAESARTDREAVPVEKEIRRFTTFLDGWTSLLDGVAGSRRFADQLWPPVLSANTWRTGVVEAVLASGAEFINDMSGLADPVHARLCARHGASLLVMHTLGLPKEKHDGQRWNDILSAVEHFFEEKLALATSSGLDHEAVVLDPGIDFAKSGQDNLILLERAGSLARFGRPVLFPISRKTVIGDVLDLPDPRDRDAGTLACLAVCQRRLPGCLFRVHDVRATAGAVRVLHAVASHGE